MEINVKDARSRLSELIDRFEDGNEIIISRRGKKVARLVPLKIKKNLPSMKEFRASLKLKGEALSDAIIHGRKRERY